MTKVKEIIDFLESFAPPSLQENYDNSGLIIGNPNQELKNILITLDCTEDVLAEAIQKQCNLIVAHHPIIFKGLKRITGSNYVERTVIQAIKHDIAIYATHTNLDNVHKGVNNRISDHLGLTGRKILAPKNDNLAKLTTFVPKEATEKVLAALAEAGAGNIGHYKGCSFRTSGIGSFVPTDEATPYSGEANKREDASEDRIEVIFPLFLQKAVMQALNTAHPYEEVAYFLHHLQNINQDVGSGMIGSLPEPMPAKQFLEYLKEKMELDIIRHSELINRPVKQVAVCGGAGSFLLKKAISAGADVFITADFKYHEFFDAEGRLIIMDIGHYESEKFTKNLLHDLLLENFTNIAVNLSEIITNPIRYS